MKKENLKKDYEIKEMRKEEIERYLRENQNHKRFFFEDSEDFSMIRENKKNLFLIKEIKEKKERRSLDRDIKISSKKIDNFGVKIIYHRLKDNSKEYRIYISFKDKNNKLIRLRLRNEEIDAISKDEKKMIAYYQAITLKDIKKKIS